MQSIKKNVYGAALVLFLIFITGNNIYAEDKSCLLFGVSPTVEFNSYSTDLRQLKEVADSVPRFVKGNNISGALSIFYRLPLSKRFSLLLRTGFDFSNVTLSSDIPYTLNYLAGDTIDFTREKIKVNLINLFLEPGIRFYFSKNIFLGGGFSISNSLKCKISDRQSVLNTNEKFLDGSSARYLIQDKKYDKTMNTAVLFSLGYELGNFGKLPFDIGLELAYKSGYNNILKDFRLDYSSLMLSCNLNYDLNKLLNKQQLEDKTLDNNNNERNVISKKTDDIRLNIKAIENRKLHDFSDITLKEKHTVNIPPLLNYVFFNENDYKIPNRYIQINKEEAKYFTLKRLLNANSLEAYHSVLNIIGRRMTDNPQAHIKLVGCNSGKNSEKDNIELSNKRVQSIINYLAETWSVDSMRIDIENRSLPENPSSSLDSMGIAENQRVEIQSDDWDILAPIIASDTLFSVEPAIAQFSISGSAENGIKTASLGIYSGTTLIKEYSFKDSIPNTIDWYLFDNIIELLNAKNEIHAFLRYADLNGRIFETNTKSIKLNIETSLVNNNHRDNGILKTERYGLVLFDFNKSELTEFHKKIIKFIASRINENATIQINGYTDLIGDESYNRELSRQRAVAVEKELRKYIKNKIKSKGMGETSLFNSNYPEARLYGRTVEIIVQTPD